MKSFTSIALLAGIGAFLAAPASATGTSGTDVSAPAAIHGVQLAAKQCMTDDGFGRMRPCSASFKKKKVKKLKKT
jgi:hypothetical protein